MKPNNIIIALLFTFFVAQSAFSDGLFRSKRINLNAGLMENMSANVTTTPGYTESKVDGSGGVGTMGFGTHINESLWGELQIGYHSIDAGTQTTWFGEKNYAVGFMPIMVGVRNYFLYEYDSGFQPYISITAGPIIGLEAKQEAGLVTANETKKETTFGSKIGGGVDFLFTSRLGMELDGGYIFMNDFKEPLNGQNNYNGWNASLGITFFWGNQ